MSLPFFADFPEFPFFFALHKALDKFLDNEEYNISSGIVLDNQREVYTKDNVTYMPIYYIMCIERVRIPESDSFF